MTSFAGQVQPLGPARDKERDSKWAALASARAYGVRFEVRVNDPSLLPAVVARLPPGSRLCRRSGSEAFTCSVARTTAAPDTGHTDVWQVHAGAELQSWTPDEKEALDAFEGTVRFEVARRAPRWTFVHAGTVGWHGRAILMPGASFAGKSTLVQALVRAGATYYSDEFAVLDRRGRVYPFVQPMMNRSAAGIRERLTAGDLGGIVGSRPLPVGMVVSTRYIPGTTWNPSRVSPGEGLLALLPHTARAQEAPARVMRLLARIVETTPMLEGARGEAEETAVAVLNRADWHPELRDIA